MAVQLQEREKNILAIISVIAVIVLFWFILKPLLGESSRLGTEIKRLENEIEDPRITKKKIKIANDRIIDLQKDIAALLLQLPETEKRGFLLRDIEDLATENHIEIMSFIPKEAIPVTMSGKEIDQRMKKYKRAAHQALEEQHAKVLRTVINIEAKGKYADLNKFLDGVMTYYRAVEITDITITRSGIAASMGVDKRFSKKGRSKDLVEEASNTDLNINFTLVAYTALQQES